MKQKQKRNKEDEYECKCTLKNNKTGKGRAEQAREGLYIKPNKDMMTDTKLMTTKGQDGTRK